MKAAYTPLKTIARSCAALLTAGVLSSNAFAQDVAATVPTSFTGTYDLTYANAQTGSPITNGTAVSVVIAPGGLLCIGGYTLTDPVTRNGNAHEAIWKESTLNIEIALSSLVNGFNEINVGSTSGTWYGQLQGSKTSTATTGCAATPAPDMTKINELFAKAQEKYSQFFPASANAVNQTLDGYIYRAYPGGIYLAINNGDVYVMGGTFGNQPTKQGSLEAILTELTGTQVDIPTIPEGDYKLVVTGTIATSVAGISVNTAFPAVTIDKIGAPDSSDIDGIRDAVKESLKDINFVGTIDVSEITSTSSDFSFKIAFKGSVTSSGVTSTSDYLLIYNYTKL